MYVLSSLRNQGEKYWTRITQLRVTICWMSLFSKSLPRFIVLTLPKGSWQVQSTIFLSAQITFKNSKNLKLIFLII